jgi:adenine-specific DNA-methyltransferase
LATRNGPSTPAALTVETLTYTDATRKNIPMAEFQSVMKPEEEDRCRCDTRAAGVWTVGGLDDEKAARNRDLDP